jgi:pyruvate dehydrogenase E1 component alpha subunit
LFCYLKQVNDAIAPVKGKSSARSFITFVDVYVKGFGTEAFGPDRKELKGSLP